MASKKKQKNKNKVLAVILAVLCGIFIAELCIIIILPIYRNENPAEPVETTFAEETTAPEPELPYITNTVTIGSGGDVLIHIPILNSGKQSDGTYNFDGLFTYTSSLIEDCDYFIANLETTLGGTENGRKYSGFPRFNSPDAIVTSLKKSGVDCLLTANNHTYDTGSHGVSRTLSVVKDAGFDFVGTVKSETDKNYLVKDIGSIKFGFGCYTYETSAENGKALNGIPVDAETAKFINSFDYADLESFYLQVEKDMTKMKKEGAEVTVIYLHWGNEYQLTPDSRQKSIAQRLCDMGVDVIIGGHPHVVQPVDLITSTDSTHKTVCVYSVGNLVSNQRRNLMGLKTGHTEDGLVFKMTFSKYSDGTVVFEKVKSVPTWIHLYSGTFNIVPLSDKLDSKASSLGLDKSSSGLSLAKASYERTMELVGEGTKKCNKYLSSLPRPDDVAVQEKETSVAA